MARGKIATAKSCFKHILLDKVDKICYAWYMDRNKVEVVQLLCSKKLSPYMTAVQHIEGGQVTHLEIKFSFRKNDELDTAINALQKIIK